MIQLAAVILAVIISAPIGWLLARTNLSRPLTSVAVIAALPVTLFCVLWYVYIFIDADTTMNRFGGMTEEVAKQILSRGAKTFVLALVIGLVTALLSGMSARRRVRTKATNLPKIFE